jgi:hypothetical protein
VAIIGGRLGGGVAAEVAFALAMAIFAVGETLLSPTLPAIVNDIAPPEAAGRYNGLPALACPPQPPSAARTRPANAS